ncbi:MAG: DUF924 family protein [Pseudomonadota bacterium]
MTGFAERARAVLEFWFPAPGHPEFGAMRKAWFAKDPAFDAEIRGAFLADVETAASGAWDGLARTPPLALALVILVDQFPRNLFRGQARAFAADPLARRAAGMALAQGFDRTLMPLERLFLYLPFEHSEDLADQRRAVALYEGLPPAPWREEAIDFARRHLAIVERFGRFPHRNAALGRPSTAAELAFLQAPGSSF